MPPPAVTSIQRRPTSSAPLRKTAEPNGSSSLFTERLLSQTPASAPKQSAPRRRLFNEGSVPAPVTPIHTSLFGRGTNHSVTPNLFQGPVLNSPVTLSRGSAMSARGISPHPSSMFSGRRLTKRSAGQEPIDDDQENGALLEDDEIEMLPFNGGDVGDEDEDEDDMVPRVESRSRQRHKLMERFSQHLLKGKLPAPSFEEQQHPNPSPEPFPELELGNIVPNSAPNAQERSMKAVAAALQSNKFPRDETIAETQDAYEHSQRHTLDDLFSGSPPTLTDSERNSPVAGPSNSNRRIDTPDPQPASKRRRIVPTKSRPGHLSKIHKKAPAPKRTFKAPDAPAPSGNRTLRSQSLAIGRRGSIREE
ncbi:hypothetical protein NMY22_g5324 [Coprinellus aureogranulatus]|nr:hypothetical protein NMY22_g5324 [Coprinellus aureogranulatus]